MTENIIEQNIPAGEFRAIDFFCGGGGMTCGLRQAGVCHSEGPRPACRVGKALCGLPQAFLPPCLTPSLPQAEQPFLHHSPRLHHLHPEVRRVKNIQPASFLHSIDHAWAIKDADCQAPPRLRTENPIPKCKLFAYIKKLLYPYTQICKIA